MAMKRYSVSRLPSGLTVATATMPDRASVSLGLWIGVGGRHEGTAEGGACHFIEHMLFKGTRRRSARELSQAVEGVGGYLNAFTGEENTCFYARARHDHRDQLLDVLSDMLLNSQFAPEEVDRERSVIQEEIAMYQDQPQQQVQELLHAVLWPDQPLGRPLTGTAESVARLGRPQLLQFKRALYTAETTFLVGAGRLRHDQLVRSAARWFRTYKPGLSRSVAPVREEQTRPVVRLHTKAVEQTQLALGIRTCSRHDPRRYALRLLSTLLGENMSSRLFQVLREEHGLAYSVYSSCSHYSDTGTLVISAGLDTENLRRALIMIVRELRRLASRAPGRAEFGRARDYVLGQMDLGLENSENQMNWVGEQLVSYGRVLSPAAVRRRLATVSPAELTAVARDFFRPDRFNLALVSPLKRATSLGRLLGESASNSHFE
jgi:predicted Zn-dependent peptidase